MLVKYDFFSFEAKLFGMSRCDGFEPARNMACIQHKPTERKNRQICALELSLLFLVFPPFDFQNGGGLIRI